MFANYLPPHFFRCLLHVGVLTNEDFSCALDIILRPKLNLFWEQRPIVCVCECLAPAKRPNPIAVFASRAKASIFILAAICALTSLFAGSFLIPRISCVSATDNCTRYQTQILVSMLLKWVSHYGVSNRSPKIMAPLHLHVRKNEMQRRVQNEYLRAREQSNFARPDQTPPQRKRTVNTADAAARSIATSQPAIQSHGQAARRQRVLNSSNNGLFTSWLHVALPGGHRVLRR